MAIFKDNLFSGHMHGNFISPAVLKAFESVPDLYLIISTELTILTASEVYLQETRTEKEKVVGKSIFDAFQNNPEFRMINWEKNLRYSLEQVLLHKRPHNMDVICLETPIPSGSGYKLAKKYWQPINTPVLNNEEQVEYIIHKVKDVTDQFHYKKEIEALNSKAAVLVKNEKAARKEAEIQQQRLYTLFMQAPAIICVLRGPDLVYELVNPPCQEVVGMNRELTGKSIREALPEIEDGVVQTIQRVYTTGKRYLGSEIPVTLDWDNKKKPYKKYFTLIYEPIFTENGDVDGVMTLGYEVTQQVQARELVEESAKRQIMILEAIPQIAWSANPDGGVDFYNKRWYDYTGLTFEESKEWGWKQALHPEDAAEVNKKWLHSLNTGNDFNHKFRLKRGSDESYRWHDGNAVPIKNQDGKIIKWVGTLMDIHDQQQAFENLEATREELRKLNVELSKKNKELTRSNTDLDNFIYSASHDLKAPINNLEGLVSLLKESILTKADQKEQRLLEMIDTSANRLNNTILDLVHITKVQKDINQAEEELVEFREVTEEIKEDIQRLIVENNALIEEDFSVEEIVYKKGNLKSIIYNLLSNAVKYRSPERQPCIKISTYLKDEQPVLSVKDNGLGLSATQQEKLFTMFRRLHSHIEGTGIGLYTIKRIIENNGGSIEVQSEAGKGSEFIVFLSEATSNNVKEEEYAETSS